MSNYRNKNILNYIFLTIAIILVKGKNIKENKIINKKSLNFKQNFDLIQTINNKLEKLGNRYFNRNYRIEEAYTNNIFYNENNKILEEKNNLIVGRNNLTNITDSISRYFFNLNCIDEFELETIQILLYTNLTNNLIFMNGEEDISTAFFIIPNDFIRRNNNILEFEVVSKNGKENGFLDIFLLNNKEQEFEFNSYISRKLFYNKNLILNKRENKIKYFINIIPDEIDSNLYYLHYKFNKYNDKDPSNEDKKNVKIYYLNDFENYTLEEIINNNIKRKKKTRDWQLKGNLEILAIELK